MFLPFLYARDFVGFFSSFLYGVVLGSRNHHRHHQSSSSVFGCLFDGDNDGFYDDDDVNDDASYV